MKNKSYEPLIGLISEAISYLNKALTSISADEEEPEKSAPVSAKTKGKVVPTSNKSANNPTKVTAKTAPKTKGKSSDDSSYTAEQLSEMSYNDLKKLCKELGIPAIGSRTQIVEKILSGSDTASADDDEDEDEAPAITSKKSGKTSAKSIKKNSKPDDEEEEADEDEEDDEESDTLKLVLEATDGMSVEEIAELLTENGISAKGKRQALIDRLVKAIDDGVISFDEGDDEKETTPDSDEDMEDEDRNPDFDKLSKARAKTFKKMSAEATANFESGKLKVKAVKKYVSDYYDGDIDLDDVDDEELFEHYLELLSLTIDDDGEVVESEEPYIINDRAYCCGHLCDYSEENGTYICPVCGGEYEAE